MIIVYYYRGYCVKTQPTRAFAVYKLKIYDNLNVHKVHKQIYIHKPF